MNSDLYTKEAVRRYLAGNISSEEQAAWRAYILTPEGRKLLDEVLNEGWDGEVDAGKPAELKRWHRKFNKLLQQQNQETTIDRKGHYPFLRYAVVAASVFIVAGFTFLISKTKDRRAVQPEYAQTITPVGSIKQINLPDGSVVFLNAASTLKYPVNFKGSSRDVYLKGEAFFDIHHDAKHPFHVHSGQLNVTVLGTSFNVKAYTGDLFTKVEVATGKVGVLNGRGKVYMLLPGEEMAVNNVTGAVMLDHMAVKDIAAWQSGEIICKNETLENISRQLTRWYGAKFIFKNKATAQIRLNVRQKYDTLGNVLKSLSIAGGFHYAIAGNTVTIW